MIVIPGQAHDQSLIAATVAEWGAGLGLAGDADTAAIRAAAERILGTPSFSAAARERAAALAGVDGAANAADEVEVLLQGAVRRQDCPTAA
jgi:UDP:flavonoid glycosyltransferase YjiC (YdhE family)